MAFPYRVRSTDEVELWLHDLGGSGPPLLLCHANGFCGPVWGPVAETLGRHYHCLAVDFRAHGRSTRPVGRSLDWHGMADDVLAVVEAISPDGPIPAVGHSLGGTALALAEVRQPGTLTRAWVYEPILFDEYTGSPRAEPSFMAAGARARRPVFADRAEVLARYSARPPFSEVDPRALQAYVDHGFEDLPDGTVGLRCRPEDEAEVYEHHQTGARSAIGDIAIPFLVAASEDPAGPGFAVLEASEEFPHLDLAVYSDLTHLGPLEAPDRIAADCLAWLGT